MAPANRIVRLIAALALLLAWGSRVAAQDQKPLSEDELVQLIDQYKDKVIVPRLEKQGIAFKVDEAVLERLKKAGASDTLLSAIRKLGSPGSADSAVIYQGVVKMLKDGLKESKIKELLAKSPTRFVLSKDQVAELKGLEASDDLIKFMQDRNTGTPVSKLTDLVIILDCSGSMDEKTPDGTSKMDAAKKVLGNIVPNIPNGMRAGFIIYGHDRSLGCLAVKVVRPVEPLDAAGKSELTKFIAGLKPVAATPIALSLRVAGKELAKRADSACGIILITDGMETCKGDPAAEAATLVKNLNLTFGVNVVGLALNDQETKAVKEIADKGKGEFYGVDDGEQLNKALKKLLEEKGILKPPPVQYTTRTVKVLDPEIEFPKLEAIVLAKPDTKENYLKNYQLAEYKKYGPFRLPSAAKYDIWWKGAGGEMHVVMLKNFSIPEPNLVEVRPEEHIGLVQVNRAEGTPKAIYVTPTGTKDNFAPNYCVQSCKKFGTIMAVPAGTWDVWVEIKEGKFDLVEEKLQVKAGKLYKFDY